MLLMSESMWWLLPDSVHL
uniref:Uncharacterized protein n=1 Tax=Rhizophora mucronata TaxID=61149 RepID=A0A2P2PZH4_RHIMU